MNLKKTGKVITFVAAAAVLITSLVNDRKSKNINEEK